MDALTVTIKGEAKELKVSSGVPGIYVLGPNSINGKSHWLQKSSSNAIWYHKGIEFSAWCIGSQDDIVSGLPPSIISFEDVASPQDITTWMYSDGEDHILSHDILVAPGTYIFNIKKIKKNIRLILVLH